MLNLEGRIGGDAGLSHRGDEYARKLPDLVLESVGVSHRISRVPSRNLAFGSGLAPRPPLRDIPQCF